MSISQVINRGASFLNSLSPANSGAVNPSTKKMNFLELLISQITHQNPMEPMDNETMVNQMVQFESLEKLDQLNETMNSSMVFQNMMNSINFLGKEVAVKDDAGNIKTGKVTGIRIEGGFPGVVVNGSFYPATSVEAIK